MPVFHNTRVLVEPEPKACVICRPGSFLPFASRWRRIIITAIFQRRTSDSCCWWRWPLSDWLLRHVKSCQWPHGDYTTVKPSFTVMVPAQWCCAGTRQPAARPDIRITRATCSPKLSAWMIDVIRHAMNGSQEREYRWLNYPGGRSAIRWRTRYRSGITSFAGVACGKNPLNVP